jgi:hypothetical protein
MSDCDIGKKEISKINSKPCPEIINNSLLKNINIVIPADNHKDSLAQWFFTSYIDKEKDIQIYINLLK